MIKILDIGFYLLISITAACFYSGVLACRYTGAKTKIMMTILIFLSHFLLLIETAEDWIFNVTQIAGEFVILFALTAGKFMEKLRAYVEMNVAQGLGTLLGYMLTREAYFFENNILRETVFLMIMLPVTWICLAGIVRHRNRGTRVHPFQGTEVLSCMLLEIFCFLYVFGMVMLETSDSMFYIYPAFIILLYLFVRINMLIRKEEKIYMEYYVLKRLTKGTEYVMAVLQEEADYYRKSMEIMNGELEHAYKEAKRQEVSASRFLRSLVEGKREKAEKENVELNIVMDIDNTMPLDVRDCVTVVANLLDNAIEATAKNVRENRKIKASLHVHASSFYFETKNPYREIQTDAGGNFKTMKADVKNHGLGLRSVREIVNKYGMEMEIFTDNCIFRVVVKGDLQKQ